MNECEEEKKIKKLSKRKKTNSEKYNRLSNFLLFFIRSKSKGVEKMAKLINGLEIAKEIRQELKQHIIEWESEGHRAPHLTAVLIGDDPASHTYVNNKIKVRLFAHYHSYFSSFIFFY